MEGGATKSGVVERVESVFGGDERDALILDGGGREREFVKITLADGTGRLLTVAGVEKEGGKTVLLLEKDCGLQVRSETRPQNANILRALKRQYSSSCRSCHSHSLRPCSLVCRSTSLMAKRWITSSL